MTAGPGRLLQQLVKDAAGSVSVVSGLTANATPDTGTDYEHGCVDHVGNPATPTAVIPVATSGAASFAVTAIDDTNATIECDTASVTFDLIVIY